MGLSLKLAVVSAAIMSTAVMLRLLTPVVTDLANSDVTTIWTSLISWLKPPYLYVVINCIIITIVASSRLQSKLEEGSHSVSTFPNPVYLPAEPVKVILPVELPLVHNQPDIPFHEPEIPFLETVKYVHVPEPVKYVHVPEPVKLVEDEEPGLGIDYVDKFISDEKRDEEMEIAKIAYEEIKKNSRVNYKKSVISISTEMNQVDLSNFSMDKPPASARFSHRKPSKSATNEGGRTLKVAKPKRQDTLETTWKTITEGRSVPLNRHLGKSDTWETHGNSRQSRNSEDLPIDQHSERMTKSDTFDVNHGRGSNRKPPPLPSKLNRSGGSGRLKKEPSLGQEELNRKVEAFIKKFNEDMRLQRQESLNQYMEMINRGAH
ncbi:uncharacterized protein [Rutidosis leptorrhynchoides]|uniref:uncharacterized protein n=1 Tax=Rutidosis leptorrhynchoides TaxID=125765 RepID=UPI003A9A0722